MNILITGAVGFIGYHLTKRLLEDKSNFIIGYDNLNDYYDLKLKIDRLAILSKHSNFLFVKGDIANKNELENIFIKHHFDVVIHLAAQAGVRYSITHPDAYLNSNLIGFFNILEMIRKYPSNHFVFASSSSIYGNQSKVPFSVDDKTDEPVSLYAATKKSNELLAYSYAKLYDIAMTGLRFFTVYGPFGRPDMAYFSFTNKIINNEPITLFNNGDMLRDFTYVDDIVSGIINVINKTPKEDHQGVRFKIYNIGNHTPTKLLDFVHTLEEVIGKKAIITYKPMQMGDVYQTYADVSELMTDFNFKPSTSIKDGLSKFYEWYKEYYHINN